MLTGEHMRAIIGGSALARAANVQEFHRALNSERFRALAVAGDLERRKK
jgi:hypothetical protein